MTGEQGEKVVAELKRRIDERTYRIGVIGLGYVGLPLIAEAVRKGFHTIGFDIDREKIGLLAAGKSYIKHFPDERIRDLNATGLLAVTDDFSRLGEADSIIICVPTPLTDHREPDMTYIVATAEAIAPYLRPGHLVTLESTTYPGTTDEVLLPILSRGGLSCGTDFFLAYSPEREDPGNPDFTTHTIPKVVGGDDPNSMDLACHMYRQLVDKVVPATSTRTAEAVKLTENIFRSVNIALVNELKIIYSRMGIDIWEVIEAAKTKPFGYMPFYPGPGLGGHCIPIDPFYLTWKAREYETPTRFIEIAGEVNTAMPAYVVQETMEAMNRRGMVLHGSTVLVVGLAYKKDVDDMRESPSLKLMELLEAKGAAVSYHDPFIPAVPKSRKYPSFTGRRSVPLDPETVAGFDVVLIATDHTAIDYSALVCNARLVIDTRNATRNVTEGREKIHKA